MRRPLHTIVAAASLSAAIPAPLVAQAPTPDSVFMREAYAKQEYRVPMRDGARLFTTVYLPRDASAANRYPIVLQRTPFSVAPYGSDAYPRALGPNRFMMREKYIFVYQDVRGRYMSEGDFVNARPFIPDSIKARNRKAVDEASGALSRHPALVASSPQAPVTDLFFEDFHHNGALTQAYFYAYPIFGIPRPGPTTKDWWLPAYLAITAHGVPDDYAYQLALGPLGNTTERFYKDNTFWREIIEHPNYDAFWQARAVPPVLRGVKHAVLVVGGWFDAEDLYGPLAVYKTLIAHDPEAKVSIVMGPFGHRGWAAPNVVHTLHGDLYFGDSLATKYQRDVETPFFRAYLKGVGRARGAEAMMFDTGRNAWRHFERWPAPAATGRTYYFHADGSLSTTRPTEASSFREYASDPRNRFPAAVTGRRFRISLSIST